MQACRYLAAKLVESRLEHWVLDREATEEDLVAARREVVGRCLYGVDVNPMAVEMAKLSLWLVTLARDKPFSFVDHAIRVGDSLVGLTNLDQLRYWSLSGTARSRSCSRKRSWTTWIRCEICERNSRRFRSWIRPMQNVRAVCWKRSMAGLSVCAPWPTCCLRRHSHPENAQEIETLQSDCTVGGDHAVR